MRKPIQLPAGSPNRFGPAPRFVRADILRALWRLGRRTGRARLASSLKLGEGSMRSILSHLQKQGLADSAPMGHKLTPRGSALLRSLKRSAAGTGKIKPSKLTFMLPALAMQIKARKPLTRAVSLRDIAVRAGASGCTLLQFRSGRLIMPPFHAPTHSEYSKELSEAAKGFSLAEGDLLIIAYGGDEAMRERALWGIFERL